MAAGPTAFPWCRLYCLCWRTVPHDLEYWLLPLPKSSPETGSSIRRQSLKERARSDPADWRRGHGCVLHRARRQFVFSSFPVVEANPQWLLLLLDYIGRIGLPICRCFHQYRAVASVSEEIQFLMPGWTSCPSRNGQSQTSFSVPVPAVGKVLRKW